MEVELYMKMTVDVIILASYISDNSLDPPASVSRLYSVILVAKSIYYPHIYNQINLPCLRFGRTTEIYLSFHL